MDGTILDAALSQGIWAVLAVFLLLYVVKENEKRDLRQEERERIFRKRYIMECRLCVQQKTFTSQV